MGAGVKTSFLVKAEGMFHSVAGPPRVCPSSTDGHAGCLHHSAAGNRAAVNVGERAPLQAPASCLVGRDPAVGLLVTRGFCLFCEELPGCLAQRGILHFHPPRQGFWSLHILASAYFVSFFG